MLCFSLPFSFYYELATNNGYIDNVKTQIWSLRISFAIELKTKYSEEGCQSCWESLERAIHYMPIKSIFFKYSQLFCFVTDFSEDYMKRIISIICDKFQALFWAHTGGSGTE